MKKRRTFSDIVYELNKAHDYENRFDLDYFSGDYEREPRRYDDYYAITRFGGCEGIYADFYVERESDGCREHIATAKTLCEDDTHYMMLHQLAAEVSLELRKSSPTF